MATCPGGGYFITDNRNAVIRFIDSNGIISTPVLDGSADPEYSNNGGLECPWGCATSPDGKTLYVVDECAEVVYGIDTTTFVVTRVAGQGSTGGSGALGWNVGDIYDMICDNNGNLLILDVTNSQVVAVNMQGTTQTIYGVSIAAGDYAALPGYPATVSSGYGVAVDSAGNLYACFQGNTGGTGNVVYKIDPTGTTTIFAGAIGVDTNTGDGGAPSAATLDSPFQVSVDKNGIVYIIPNGQNGGATTTIRAVNTSGTTQTVCGVSIAPNTIETIFTFGGSANIWYTLPDNQGNLYVCDVGPRDHGCRVFLLTSAGGYSVVAGDATGVCGFAGDGGPATSALIGEAFAIALAPGSNPSLCSCGPQPIGNPLI